MAVADQITRIQTAKENIKTSLSAKGVDVGDAKLDEYSTFIDEMQVGGGVSEYFTESIAKGTAGSDTNKYVTSGLVQTMKKVPEEIVFSGDSCQYMFWCCTALEEAPELDTSSVTNMYNMFYCCRSLKIVPSYNSANVTDFRMMFSGCSSWLEAPELDTSSAPHMSSMFSGCTNLINVPKYNTSLVTDMSTFFGSCSSLLEAPELDTSSCNNFTTMFSGCTLMTDIPELDTSLATKITSMFAGCTNLTNFGGLKNLGQAYLTTASANYSYYTLTLSSSNNLTHDSLMNVINNLYDIATAGVKTQKLVLGSTNLAKLTDEEIAIATSRGWTVS